MVEYSRLRHSRLRKLSTAATQIVKAFVENELGEIPLDEMEIELRNILEDWIDEFDSEKHLQWKLENKN